MQNTVQNTWTGQNYFTNPGNQFVGIFSGTFSGSFIGTITGVPTLAGNNTFTGTNTFTNVLTATNASNVIHGTFTGNGAAITNIDPTHISSGTAAIDISGSAVFATNSTTSVNFSGGLSGDVTGTQGATVVSNVAAANIAAGTNTNAINFNNAANVFKGTGANITGIKPSNLTGSGTVPPEGLNIKSGLVKLAVNTTSVGVTFNTAFATENYAVIIQNDVTPSGTDATDYTGMCVGRTAGGFTIFVDNPNILHDGYFGWIAVPFNDP